MTLHSNDFEAADPNLDSKVADYLLAHPDLLIRYPDVLAKLEIPHDTGDAVSLIERQVKLLRQQARDAKAQLHDLIKVARENDSLARRLHRLTLALIATRSFDEVLNTLQDELRNLFQADAVEIKLFDQTAKPGSDQPSAMQMFDQLLTSKRPSCGQFGTEQLDYLFGSQASDTGSAALIPLQSASFTGVLAIGSRDPGRFHASQGVDFLHRLSDVVSVTLSAVSSPGE